MAVTPADPDSAAPQPKRGRLLSVVESAWFRHTVTTLILLNAVTLGLATYPGVARTWGPALALFDQIVIIVFVAEVVIKLAAYRMAFFKDGWRIFDLIIVSIAVIPNAGPFSVLRALRVMRLFHVMSVMPQLRQVVEALFRALPGMGGIVAVMVLVFYVFSVMATQMFGSGAAEGAFQNVGSSALTLFQVMTGDDWTSVMNGTSQAHPYAWVFFIVFITLTSFIVLNLFIAVIVDAMHREAFAADEERDADAEAAAIQRHEELTLAIVAMREELATLKAAQAAEDQRSREASASTSAKS